MSRQVQSMCISTVGPQIMRVTLFMLGHNRLAKWQMRISKNTARLWTSKMTLGFAIDGRQADPLVFAAQSCSQSMIDARDSGKRLTGSLFSLQISRAQDARSQRLVTGTVARCLYWHRYGSVRPAMTGKLNAAYHQISTSSLFEPRLDRRLLQEGLITTVLVSTGGRVAE